MIAIHKPTIDDYDAVRFYKHLGMTERNINMEMRL